MILPGLLNFLCIKFIDILVEEILGIDKNPFAAKNKIEKSIRKNVDLSSIIEDAFKKHEKLYVKDGEKYFGYNVVYNLFKTAFMFGGQGQRMMFDKIVKSHEQIKKNA